MTSISLDATGKIETATVDLIVAVDRVAGELNVPYFIAGACARDVVLGCCFGIPTGEATRDVDFAFLMEDWEQYASLADGLTATGEFQPHAKISHRFVYQSTHVLDLMPFGGIEHPPGRIHWPPDFAFAMSMHGFREAYERAVDVAVAPGVIVRFASPDGLMALKLFAWRDRGHEAHGKDARDITLLLGHYLDAGNHARLYEEHSDLLEDEDFDYELAGSRILGRDLGSWLSPATLDRVLNIMAGGLSEEDDYPLARGLSVNDEKALRLLQSFEQGLRDGFRNG